MVLRLNSLGLPLSLGLIAALAVLLTLTLAAEPAEALSPEKVVVIANPQVNGSLEVAQHYRQARELPEGNLLSVWAPATEIINRTQYDEFEANLSRALSAAGLDRSVEVLVLVYGVPLKIDFSDEYDDSCDINTSCARNRTQASVDSELALLYSQTPSGNQGESPNPYYASTQPFLRKNFDDILLITRLDGPSPDDAKDLVDRALAAEAENRQAWAYFDRDPDFEDDAEDRMEYGHWIEDSFNLSLERGLPAALEPSNNDIGEPGARWTNKSSSGAEPANDTVTPFFYWGWYENKSYYDSFDWPVGAVGQRIHSLNAESMRENHWVSGAVADNLTGTAGHVWEPWLENAARPQIWLPALLDGYSLAEAFWMATPNLSWQNIVVGDPLYTPVQPNFSFRVEGPPPGVMLPGQNRTVNLTLTNHSPLHQTFELATVNLPQGLTANLSLSQVRLNGSGGRAEVAVQLALNPDSNLSRPGDHVFNLLARTADGASGELAVPVSLRVDSYPDLRVEAFHARAAWPNALITINVTGVPMEWPGEAGVENFALKPSARIEIRLDNLTVHTFWLSQPTQQFNFTLEKVVGVHLVSIEVDPDQRHKETNETNNLYEMYIKLEKDDYNINKAYIVSVLILTLGMVVLFVVAATYISKRVKAQVEKTVPSPPGEEEKIEVMEGEEEKEVGGEGKEKMEDEEIGGPIQGEEEEGEPIQESEKEGSL